jgi:ribonuclease P protein component
MPAQQSSRSAGESLRREERLRRRADFLRCYESGRRRYGSLVILYVLDRGPEVRLPRLGITVSRRVGGAVVRQRIKRRIREIFRRWSERSKLPPCDLVVHVRPRAREADFQALRSELQRLLLPLVRCSSPGE